MANTKPMTYKLALTKLKKYQRWRHGICTTWSKRELAPPGEELDEILDVSISALKKVSSLNEHPNI